MIDEAVAKLQEGLKKGKFDQKGKVMSSAVCRALEDFCRQDEEFAQAVVQGGSFEDCMKDVSKAVKGNGISDIDAYTAAVRFYFPGAGIVMQMRIDLCASVRGKGKKAPAADDAQDSIVLNLADFL